jgi:competence protein ComEC
LLVGAEPPVVRAAIMASGIALASVAGRRTPGWVYLLYAAAIMLAIDPLLARDVAFQLSMSATAGVMLIAPPLRDTALGALAWEERRVRAAIVEVAATATGAALAVVPVQAAAFEQLPLLTIPSNILVAPLYEATLVVALVAALGGWLDPVADLLMVTGRFVPEAFLGLVDVLADAPASVVEVRAPLLAGAAWYVAIGVLVWAIERRGPTSIALEPYRRTGLELTAGLAIVAGGLWLAVLSGGGDGRARVTVLDVGQGLAVLVQDRGASVLVDTGPPDGAVLRALPRAGAGRQLDALVLTHSDSDHAGGLVETERRIAVGTLLASAGTLDELSLRGEAIDIGDRIRVSERTSIEVLSPPVQTVLRAHESDNNGSFVLLVRIGDIRVLLTADIETPAERWLTSSGLDLRADAIVVPHHGSATSSTEAFVQAVAPRVAIVSAGADNPFGHPRPDVLARYGDALLYRTDEDGSVTLRSDGERLWVDSER